MKPYGYLFALSGAIMAISSATALADHQLSKVEITAKAEQTPFVPLAPSSEINAEDIQQTNSINTEEALKYQPELVIRSRYIGDSNALVAMRDSSMMQSARSLVLVDGMLISNFLGAGYANAPLWATTAPEEIESIQVLYGPFDAQYSGNTMGGAVLMRTRLPSEFEASVKASAFMQTFSDYGQSHELPGYKVSALAGGASGAWHYRALFSRVDSQAHPQSYNLASAGGTGSTVVNGAQPYENTYVVGAESRTDTSDALYKAELGYDLTAKLQLRGQVAYQRASREQLRPYAYIHDNAGNDIFSGNVRIDGDAYKVNGKAMSFGDSERLLTGLALQGELSERWSTQSNLSWFKVLDNRKHNSGTGFTSLDDQGSGKLVEDDGTHWLNLDLRLARSNNGGLAGNSTRMGYHFDQYHLDENTYKLTNWRQNQTTSLDAARQGTTQTQAIYLQNEWSLADNLLLNLGVRQEFWQAFDGRLEKENAGVLIGSDYPRRSEHATSPKLSLDYFINSDWQLSTMLARAVRFPTLGELYQGGINNDGSFEAKFNPDLKAETGLHANIGLTRTLLHGQWRVDVWQNRIKNSIYQQSSVWSGINSYQNIDRTQSTGLSFSSQWRELWHTPLSLSTNLAYTRPKIEQNANVPNSEGKDIPRVPRWRGNLLASYQLHPLWQLSSGLRYSSDPYDTLENTDGSRSGFGYTDEFLVWDAKLSFHKHQWSWAAGINNINNERYYVYHPYPGRTFFMEAQWHAF